MNQIHRLGLGVAGIAAVVTVGSALVVDGYVSANQVAQASATPTVEPTVEPTDSPTPSLGPLTIYVKPAPTPPAVRVVKPAVVVAPKPVTPMPVTAPPEPVVTPPTIRVIVPSPTGEGGDD
jgi:hypothetical protein